MEPSFHEAGVELDLAVAAVVQAAEVDGGDDDERGVAAEVLVEADEEELVSQVARAQGSVERRPAVEARLETLDGVGGDEVRHAAAAERRRQRPLRHVTRNPAGGIHEARRPALQDDVVEVGGGRDCRIERNSARP